MKKRATEGEEGAEIKRPKNQSGKRSRKTSKTPRKNSFSAPHPMDLLRISRDFGLLVPEMFDEVVDEESGESHRRLSPMHSYLCRTALEDAAHLYHLAQGVADISERDPWISRDEEAEEIFLRKTVLNLWKDVESMGTIVTNPEAIMQSETYKTVRGLRKGLKTFGLREARLFRNSTIEVLDRLTRKWNRERDTISRKLRRTEATSKGKLEKEPSDPWLKRALEIEIHRLIKAAFRGKKMISLPDKPPQLPDSFFSHIGFGAVPPDRT